MRKRHWFLIGYHLKSSLPLLTKKELPDGGSSFEISSTAPYVFKPTFLFSEYEWERKRRLYPKTEPVIKRIYFSKEGFKPTEGEI
jgi:hypothetical protein